MFITDNTTSSIDEIAQIIVLDNSLDQLSRPHQDDGKLMRISDQADLSSPAAHQGQQGATSGKRRKKPACPAPLQEFPGASKVSEAQIDDEHPNNFEDFGQRRSSSDRSVDIEHLESITSADQGCSADEVPQATSSLSSPVAIENQQLEEEKVPHTMPESIVESIEDVSTGTVDPAQGLRSTTGPTPVESARKTGNIDKF